MIFRDEETGLYYEKREDGIVITDADKKLTEISIPKELEGLKVISVGKKAFLGCRSLRSVVVPGTINKIEDWAFANCPNLKEIVLSTNNCILGQGVFKNSDSLQDIFCPDMGSEASKLLAATVTLMDAEYLLTPSEIHRNEWYNKWDQKLEYILDMRDDEGYHLYVLCGEEDLHFDYDQYVEYIREKKSALCMLRLLNDYCLEDIFRCRIRKYILDSSKGRGSEAAWKYVLKNKGDIKDYYELLINIGGAHKDNLEGMLLDMGERHVEMKAFLIEQIRGKGDTSDFFDDLFL